MVQHVTRERKKVKEIKIILANNPRIAINSQNHLQLDNRNKNEFDLVHHTKTQN